MADGAGGGGFVQSSVCEQCGSISFSQEWHQAFGVVLCQQCKREEELISKGNAKTRFLLSDKDLQGLGFIVKENPQHKSWTGMKLYLKAQVVERAIAKHGDLSVIEDRKHAKVQTKLQERLKRKAAHAADEDDEDDEDDGVDNQPRRAMSAAAVKVRQRLATDYEKGSDAAAGTSGGAACEEVEEF